MCKNINYLVYFYHLFPIHVDKFYLFFHIYVNPRIEQLKESIGSLEGEKISINSQIKDLKNMEIRIEYLSSKIKFDVEELNKSISSHDGFKFLVDTIMKQLENSIGDLKSMDKTKDIDNILAGIVKQIKTNYDRKLRSIKGKLAKHEQDVKGKLAGYISITKNGLSSIKMKMSDLEKKIDCYIQLAGNFDNLETQLRAYYQKVNDNYMKKKKYIGYGHRFSMGYYNEVEQKLKELNKHRNEYEKKIDETKKELMKLYRKLCCEGNVRTVIREVEKNGGGYAQILSQIPSFVADLKHLENFGVGIKKEGQPMKCLLEITTNIELAKSIVDEKNKDLDPILPHLLKDTLAIKTQELDGLINDITILRTSISTSIKHLNNTKLLIDYFIAFESQKKKFEEIQINEYELERIDKLICSIKQFEKGYEELTRSVFQYSHKLLSKFEKGLYDSGIRGGKFKYLPKNMRLGIRPLDQVKNHIKKLQAIKSVKSTLSWYSIDLFVDYIEHPKKSDIDGLLEELKEIDKTLTGSWYVGYNIGKIRETYEENKLEISNSDARNGYGIKSHVESIEKIPNKISELQSLVRWSIVILEIAKSVNETLEGVKGETKELERIKTTLEEAKGYIEFIKKEYESIREIVRIMESFKDSITHLNSLKENIKWFRGMINGIHIDIRSIQEKCKEISKSISEIIGYEKDLFKISGEIAKGFSKIGIHHLEMPGVIFSHTLLGSILHGIHGLWLPLISSPLLILSVHVGFIMRHLSLIRLKEEQIAKSKIVEFRINK